MSTILPEDRSMAWNRHNRRHGLRAAQGFKVGNRVVADNSELSGHCFYCRRGKDLFCENFIAHGVMVDGGFAEYAAYPAARDFHINNLSEEGTTLLEPAACAAHGLDMIKPAMGSRVLLFGAGPTGLMLAQFLRVNGGCFIVLVVPEGVKLELARKIGIADLFVGLPRGGEEAKVMLEELRAANPDGCDVVVEATGSARVLEQCLSFCTEGWEVGHL